jgi:hypothetical protein
MLSNRSPCAIRGYFSTPGARTQARTPCTARRVKKLTRDLDASKNILASTARSDAERLEKAISPPSRRDNRAEWSSATSRADPAFGVSLRAPRFASVSPKAEPQSAGTLDHQDKYENYGEAGAR